MAFLVLDGISKSYGPVHALVDMNLQVDRGEFISLLGPSGCGKTTTLQALAGFVPVTRGRIVLDGQDITHLPAHRRGLGIVFQSYALFPHMTVAQNVAFGLEMRGIAPAERTPRVERMLDLVQLASMAGRYPRELSGGQRQRVALARALVIEPPVLLLDEPLSNLDAKLRDAMQFELRRIQRKLGTTTIMVTHDQAEALSISDRVVVMENGHTRQIDTPSALYERPCSAFVSSFVGKSNLLPAQGDAGGLRLGGVQVRAHADAPGGPLADGAPALLALRPEKLRLLPPDPAAGSARQEGSESLAATVRERYFLGGQWLYRVATPIGELDVSQPNDGRAPWSEGDAVRVAWDVAAARVLRGEASASATVDRP